MNLVGGFWDTIKSAPMAFKRLFIHDPEPLSKQTFKGLYEIDWAPEGSNERKLQADTIYCWEELLTVYEARKRTAGAVKLEELLTFISSCDRIPPTGFEDHIKITFVKTENERRYPSSSTCGMELVLPYPITEPDDFQRLMDEAIHEAQGFYKP
ncbi:G2/M phase-specific E3 ubiquitin-protein ligase [Holothuria leucospilota]|uniref:G2/M phase-specific E3 ubiquitin-protein ligase n=1 Tax=Holothuria leucospilota TaxID=206669 RepID=A0A9Q1CQG3_HOLLE|nr:G2/M phase-specific E3 ubiquitin-protein ligase [Holothuria leucospilota]